MGLAAKAPAGGVAADIGGRSRPLVLRNAEIERFEAHYDVGLFDILHGFLGRGSAPQVRHVRDLVALGLIGGGMTDSAADALIGGLPPSENTALRIVAHDLVLMAFVPPVRGEEKKSDLDGSAPISTTESGDGTFPPASATSPASD